MAISSANRAGLLAAVCAGVMIAQQVGAKATRDALFLSTYGIAALPTMLIVSAAISVGIIPIVGRALQKWGPSRLVPPVFAASATLTMGEWALTASMPRLAAVLVYLHVGSLGSVLISWFWSLINERFDPRTAKHLVSRIAAGATLGGLVGGLVAARLAKSLGPSGMLPSLAAMHLVCGGFALILRQPHPAPANRAAAAGKAGLSLLWRSSYLRDLAVLVSLGAIGAALLDYVFKLEATQTYAKGAPLLRFFAIFYTATGVATFAVQTTLARRVLEKLGVAKTVSSLPVTLGLGSIASLIAPGLWSLGIARGAEMTVRSSLFRSSYELFYMPVAPEEKRSVKAMIDVGGERLGDLVGGGLVKLALLLAPGKAYGVLVGAAIALAALALYVTRQLHRGYLRTLERSLIDRAGALEIDETADPATVSILTRTRSDLLLSKVRRELGQVTAPKPATPRPAEPVDPVAARLKALHSGDREQVCAALREPIPPPLVHSVIMLLGWDDVCEDVLKALRDIAPSAIGQITDALLDPDTEFTIRRRLPRVLAGCDSPRAAEALLGGLADSRFEVRYQCGRALDRIHERNPKLELSSERIQAAVLREVAVDRKVWESQRLLDHSEETEHSPFVDKFLRDRAGRSLEHVFTLVSLTLPKQPLIVAFRGLHTSDEGLRGTALEYLEGVLPDAIHDALWPFLEDKRPAKEAPRARDQILDELMHSHASIELNLKNLREVLAAKSK
jgi:ATP:ADP antiporter, AAA family